MLDHPPASKGSVPTLSGALDALLPAAMAVKAEETGARKCAMDSISLLVLSVLAGAFISFGAIFATTVSAGTTVALAAQPGDPGFAISVPYGLTRLLAGIAFSLGLVLVIVGGAELFTGNNLIVMAWASRKVKSRQLLTNWALAFIGNSLGAGLTACLMFLTAQYAFGHGAVGAAALATAMGKVSLGTIQAFTLGIMCNTLVCLAVWMSYSARTTADRVFIIVPPIAAFVAAGFEHSIANVYFLTIAYLIKKYAPEPFWQMIGRAPTDFESLSMHTIVVNNLIPVTLGNIVGGSFMVAAVYWFIYLRKRT